MSPRSGEGKVFRFEGSPGAGRVSVGPSWGSHIRIPEPPLSRPGCLALRPFHFLWGILRAGPLALSTGFLWREWGLNLVPLGACETLTFWAEFLGVHCPRSREQSFHLILKGAYDFLKIHNGWPRTWETCCCLQ